MPTGYNTTQIKGNEEINFLPGTNLKIVKGNKEDIPNENQSPSSNPEVSTGATMKPSMPQTTQALAKPSAMDENELKAEEDPVKTQMLPPVPDMIINQEPIPQTVTLPTMVDPP